jgi:hypothetical protein
MMRAALVPFAVPGRVLRPMPLLGLPQLVLLIGGVLLVCLTILLLIYPVVVQAWARHDVLAYRETYGFDVGMVMDDRGYEVWAFTRIVPGGPAAKAGLQVEDVIYSYHDDSSASQLLWALDSASTGRQGCLDVRNLRDRRTLREALRRVCLERPDP